MSCSLDNILCINTVNSNFLKMIAEAYVIVWDGNGSKDAQGYYFSYKVHTFKIVNKVYTVICVVTILPGSASGFLIRA